MHFSLACPHPIGCVSSAPPDNLLRYPAPIMAVSCNRRLVILILHAHFPTMEAGLLSRSGAVNSKCSIVRCGAINKGGIALSRGNPGKEPLVCKRKKRAVLSRYETPESARGLDAVQNLAELRYHFLEWRLLKGSASFVLR
jgi:hypothetical protein